MACLRFVAIVGDLSLCVELDGLDLLGVVANRDVHTVVVILLVFLPGLIFKVR